jgi:RNA polymerase sigma-70 factor (ECF subfamily)
MHKNGKHMAGVVKLVGKELSNHEIVAGLLDAKPQAAAALYDRFAGRVNQLVWRILGADQEHDDVVQQVFVNALGSIGKLKNPGALEGWMVGVAVNTVRRELRGRKVRRILSLVPGTYDLPQATLDPDSQLVTPSFYQAVSRMRAATRIVFILRFVEGYTLGECAAACRCSLSTVKRRLTRARRAFFKFARKDPVLASWIEEVRDG